MLSLILSNSAFHDVTRCNYAWPHCSFYQTNTSTPTPPSSSCHSYPTVHQEGYLFWEEGGKLSIITTRNRLVTRGHIHTFAHLMSETHQKTQYTGHMAPTHEAWASFFCSETSGPPFLPLDLWPHGSENNITVPRSESNCTKNFSLSSWFTFITLMDIWGSGYFR